MHSVIVPTRQYVHLVRVLAILSCSATRHLQIKAVKDALSIIGSLQLHIAMQTVLDTQILYEVMGLAKIPHLYIEVVATGKQG